jgi:Flp pilus assembly protein TadG
MMAAGVLRRVAAAAGATLRAVRSDTRGNVLMIAAASLIPLLGMLGGALDVSRAYLVKARLQQACDAAVLGGRRNMQGETWTHQSKEVADRYFESNFPDGRYDTEDVDIAYRVGSDLIVHGSATATMNTAIMYIFGKDTVDLAATCDAKLELPNADIMFVLDTTLSMSQTNPGDSVSRISALRTAVNDFYDTLEDAKGSGTRVRYGFVPYSNTVNVGMLLKREWMADNGDYQSREYLGSESVEGTTDNNPYTTTSSTGDSTGGSRTYPPEWTIPPESCVAPASTVVTTYIPSSGYIYTSGSASSTYWERYRDRIRNGSTYTATLSGTECKVKETKYENYKERITERRIDNPNYGKTGPSRTAHFWAYRQRNFPLTALKGSNADGLMAGGSFDVLQFKNDRTTQQISWPGATGACIEERRTDRSNDMSAIAANSDLDVDGIPTADITTKWKPYIPALVYGRNQGNLRNPSRGSWPGLNSVNRNNDKTESTYQKYNDSVSSTSLAQDRAGCPSAARKLEEMNNGQITSYLNGLAPRGMTYHDIGFLWGLRLMSAQGLFAAENQAPAGGRVARHIIFMTDGQTETNIADYDAYGVAALDRRRTPENRIPVENAARPHELDGVVNTRLQHLCGVAKAKGITVWVIAFGTALTTMLEDCADEDRAFQANNAVELNETFAQIAAQISQLRLTR